MTNDLVIVWTGGVGQLGGCSMDINPYLSLGERLIKYT